MHGIETAIEEFEYSVTSLKQLHAWIRCGIYQMYKPFWPLVVPSFHLCSRDPSHNT